MTSKASDPPTADPDVPGSSRTKGFAIPYGMSVLVRYILYRLNRNQEIQIIITGRSAVRGLGKTHLAVALSKFIHDFSICPHCDYIWIYGDEDECRRCEKHVDEWIDMPEWTHEDNSVVGNVDKYISDCLSTSQEAMVFDEVEESADNRRPMSSDVVKLRQALMKLRVQNNITIMTLPTSEVLDGSVQNLLDVWINVQRRGDANAYHFWVNDFPPYVRRRIRMRLENGMAETIHWKNMDGDPDIQALSERKKQLILGSLGGMNEETEELLKEQKKEWTVELTERLLDRTELPQRQIAEDIVEMSQQWVSKANRGRVPQQSEDEERYPIRA